MRYCFFLAETNVEVLVAFNVERIVELFQKPIHYALLSELRM